MQDEVLSRMPIGIPGQLADLHTAEFGDVISSTNEEASAEIPFGLMVKQGTGGSRELCKLPTAAAGLLGVTVHAQNFAKPVQLGDDGIKPGVTVGVLRKGKIYVELNGATAVTPASEVHVRVAGAGQLGSFSGGTGVAAETVDISAFARWCGSGSEGDVVAVEIDMTNSASAVIDA